MTTLDAGALDALAKNRSFGQLGGSCERFAEAIAMACMERGIFGLAGAVLTLISTFGEVCFLTYDRLAGAITLPNGRHPHPESVGRVVRWLGRIGLVAHERIGPGIKPRKARFPSPHGTTENRICPTRLGVKRIAKSNRSHLRTLAADVLAPVGIVATLLAPSSDVAQAPTSGRPRYHAPAPAAAFVPPELASMGRAARARATEPPSPAELNERRRRQLEALAAWELEHPEARAGPDPPAE